MAAIRKTAKTAKAQAGGMTTEERNARLTALNERHAALSEQRDMLSERLAACRTPVCGMKVRHRAFGEGVIAKETPCEEGYSIVEIDFGSGKGKRFQIPQAFAGGFLAMEEAGVTERITEAGNVAGRIHEVTRELSAIEHEAERLKAI